MRATQSIREIKEVKINFRMPQRSYSKIIKIAKKHDLSVSSVVRQMVESFDARKQLHS